MVLGVTSISFARVEQLGYLPVRMILWISITRHIAGRLAPERIGERDVTALGRDRLEGDTLDILAKNIP